MTEGVYEASEHAINGARQGARERESEREDEHELRDVELRPCGEAGGRRHRGPRWVEGPGFQEARGCPLRICP